MLASAFGALAVLPYSDRCYIADFNIGIFYIAAITSMEVLGILMAGWASNNKWALLGGMRSAAQIVSYELPVGLAILTGILIAGTMSMQGMTYDQFGFAPSAGMEWPPGWFWQWNFFHPAMFILAPIYFLAALAECNRTPFDIPEAESELVARLPHRILRHALRLLLHGRIRDDVRGQRHRGDAFPRRLVDRHRPLEALMMKPPVFSNGVMSGAGFPLVGTLIHLVASRKTYFLVFIMMWIRWTLPRFRVDQMMTLCWKKLIPLGMLCFTGVASGCWCADDREQDCRRNVERHRNDAAAEAKMSGSQL